MHPWNEPRFDALKRSLERLPHALLVHGPRGVGKLALAERISQLLLCEAAEPASRPCGSCEGCRWYLGGNHPDFRRLEPEALAKEAAPAEAEEGGEVSEAPARKGKPSLDIRIEQVRALADFLNVTSHRHGLRVALIHPAEEMNPPTANSLLKALEEPPAGAVFILVSHRPARLLPTIRSRCIAIPVPVPPRDAALAWLKAQGVENADRWLAYAGGAPLRAAEYAANALVLDRILKSPYPVDDRESLERLAEALQKLAYDRAFGAFGLTPKYRTGAPAGRNARAWLAFARRMGESRALTRHPLNPTLFSAALLGELGDLT
jgi:DNA polymerase-3 subunit delta'